MGTHRLSSQQCVIDSTCSQAVLTKWLFHCDDGAIEPSEILDGRLCGSEGVLDVVDLSFEYNITKRSHNSRPYVPLQSFRECQVSQKVEWSFPIIL